MFFKTMSQLGDTLKGIAVISNGTIRVLDAKRIPGQFIDRLAWTAAFHEKVEMRGTARWLIKMLAPSLGICFEAGPAPQDPPAFNPPAVQIKGMTYDFARAFFRATLRQGLQAVLLIDPEKQARDAATFIAAAIQAGFQERLFFQNTETRATDARTILLEVFFKESQENHEPALIVKESADGRRLHIAVRIFVEKTAPPGEQEALLWQLPSNQRAHLSLEIEKALEAHFRKWREIQKLPMVQKKGRAAAAHFSLREEIAAAIKDESMPAKNQAFIASFLGSKNRNLNF